MNDFDVLVVGGGVAGVSAAIAAARVGAKTALMEMRPFVGGNATSGLIIEGYHTRLGQQVIYGLGEEYVRRLEATGGAVGHLPLHGRFHSVTPVDGDRFRILVTRLLAEAGVTVLYQTMAVGVSASDGRVHSVDAAMKGAVHSLTSDVVVDASGDADVAVAAGANYRKGRPGDERMQAVSMLLRCYGTDNETAAAAISPNGPHAIAHKEGFAPFPAYFSGDFSRWNDVIRSKGLFPHDNHRGTFNSVWPDELNVNTTFLIDVDGTDARSVAKATVELTHQADAVGHFLRDHVPGFHRSRHMPATIVGVRETRNVVGVEASSDTDVLTGTKHADTIGRSALPTDIHHPETGIAYFQEIGGDGSFDIRYGCLLPEGLDNVLVAGRCISASYNANGSTRAMASCIVSGQAAGVAGALASATRRPPGEVDLERLQSTLRGQDVYLGETAKLVQ